MKTIKLTIILIFISITANAQSWFYFNQDEEQFISIWIDPTFDDAGAQLGIEFTKELEWGYVQVGMSRYEELNPTYTDLSVSIGLAFHMFRYEGITYYFGLRGGYVWRGDSDALPMGGASLGFDMSIGKLLNIPELDNLTTGLTIFSDYRSDQANDKFGDSDAYERGFITNNPMIQDNIKGRISLKF